MPQDVGRLLSGRGLIDAHGHAAGHLRPNRREHPLHPTIGDDANRTTHGHAQGDASRGKRARTLLVLGKGQRHKLVATSPFYTCVQRRSGRAAPRMANQAVDNQVATNRGAAHGAMLARVGTSTQAGDFLRAAAARTLAAAFSHRAKLRLLH